MNVLKKNRSMVIVKPDMVSRSLNVVLEKRLRENGLCVIGIGKFFMDMDFVKRFYQWTTIYHPLEIGEYLCQFQLDVWLIEGENAIQKLIAIKRDMREKYCKGSKVHNLFHCSDNQEEFEREYSLIISKMGDNKMKTNNQVEVIVFKKTKTGFVFLLLKRNPQKGGFWQPITGNVEIDETFEQAAMRELQEETGIPDIKRFVDTGYSFEFFDDNRQQKEKVFGVEVRTETTITLSAEHTDFVWVTYEDALSRYLKYPGNKEGLKSLLKKIKEK